MTETEHRVLFVLLTDNIIPNVGIFQITEDHLESYMRVYGEITNGGNFGDKSNKRFARKLAGRTLIKLNLSRGARFNDIEAGMVYLIENPSFKDHYKVGMCLDVIDRLSQYQTYDPYRKFSIKRYDFVLNRTHTEKRILVHPQIFKEAGEWIKKQNAENIFNLIAAYK